MSTLNESTEKRLKDIEAETGKTLTELFALMSDSKHTSEADLREYVSMRLNVNASDAELLVRVYIKSIADAEQEEKAAGDPVADA